MNNFKFSDSSRIRMSGVDARLIRIANRAIQISRVDFGIPKHGGRRSRKVQLSLFVDKKSKCDGLDNISNHQKGIALDVYAYVDGKASWDEYHLSMVACAMLQAASELGYKLKWGGLWKSWQDMPHFELDE
ncbi:MAG: M15 family metallopeptidase [Immundisolibacteraceae bacterium]|nr:M15 family metallopeptidase [Immundisolibacteraceae bacterium]